MNDYELIVLSQDTSEGIHKKMEAYAKDLKGSLAKAQEWGKKRFMYPIKKKQSGFYGQWTLSLPAAATVSFKRKLQLDSEILRYLLRVKK